MKMADMSTLVPQSRKADGSTAPARIVICGEVSAGKSTVLNALLRDHVLPDNIGQAQRPLVIAGWRQDPGIEIEHLDGRQSSAALHGERALFQDAGTVRLWQDHPHLAGIELIELPLTRAEDLTDEQIDLVASADVMIWVTIGSQAWRLTEKAIVESFGEARPGSSILVVTRADKLRNDNDRGRMMDRLTRETSELFGTRLFLHGDRRRLAASAGSEAEWEATGGAALAARLHEILENPENRVFGGARRAAPVEDVLEAIADLSDDVAAEEAPEPVEEVTAEDPAEETVAIAGDAAAEEEAAPEPVEITDEAVAQEAAADPVADEPEAVEPVAEVAPAPNAAAPARAAIPGVLIAGVSHHPRDDGFDILGGTAEEVELVGRFCENLNNTLGTAWPGEGSGGAVSAFSLSTSGRRLLFQIVPGVGLVFLMADAAVMSQGLANMALNQLCADLRPAGSAA